jgi:hypothetical protein
LFCWWDCTATPCGVAICCIPASLLPIWANCACVGAGVALALGCGVDATWDPDADAPVKSTVTGRAPPSFFFDLLLGGAFGSRGFRGFFSFGFSLPSALGSTGALGFFGFGNVAIAAFEAAESSLKPAGASGDWGGDETPESVL